MNPPRYVIRVIILYFVIVLPAVFVFIVLPENAEARTFTHKEYLFDEKNITLENGTYKIYWLEGTPNSKFTISFEVKGISEERRTDIYIMDDGQFERYCTQNQPFKSGKEWEGITFLDDEEWTKDHDKKYGLIIDNQNNAHSTDTVPTGNLSYRIRITHESELFDDLSAYSGDTTLKVFIVVILLSAIIFSYYLLKGYGGDEEKGTKKEVKKRWLFYAFYFYIVLSFPSILYYMFISPEGLNLYFARFSLILYLTGFMGIVFAYYFFTPKRTLRVQWITRPIFLFFGIVTIVTNIYLLGKDMITLYWPEYNTNTNTPHETIYKYLHDFFGLSVTLAEFITIYIIALILFISFLMAFYISWMYTYELNMWGKGKKLRAGGRTFHIIPYVFTLLTAISIVVLFAYVFSTTEIDPTKGMSTETEEIDSTSEEKIQKSSEENRIKNYSFPLGIITFAGIGYLIKLAGWGYGFSSFSPTDRKAIQDEWTNHLIDAIAGEKITGKRAEKILIDAISHGSSDTKKISYMLYEVSGMKGLDRLCSRYNNTEEFDRKGNVVKTKRDKKRNIVKALSYLAGYGEHGEYRRIDRHIMTNREKKRLAPFFVSILDNKDTRQVEYAVKGIGKLKDPTYMKSVESKLKSTDVYVKAAAIEALGEMDETGASLSVIREMTRESDASGLVRERVAVALGIIGKKAGSRTIINLLREMLGDHDKNVRFSALRSLADINMPQARVALVRIVEQGLPDRDMLKYALQHHIPTPQTISSLFRHCDREKEQDPEIRKLAFEALLRSPDPRGVGACIYALDDVDESIVVLARMRIGFFKGNPPHPQVFVEMLQSPDPLAKKFAVLALGSFGGAGYLSELLPLLSPSYPLDLRRTAVMVLGRMRDERAIPFLVKALEDRALKEYALLALQSINTPEARRILDDMSVKHMWGG